MAKLVSPEERAESLRQAIQIHIEPAEVEGAGHYWMLSAKVFARIAAAIREAENAALERAAELCDAAHQEGLVTRSKIIGPDYFVVKALASRELAAAIRHLKREPDGQSLSASRGTVLPGDAAPYPHLSTAQLSDGGAGSTSIRYS